MARYIDADWITQNLEGWQDQLAKTHGDYDEYVLCIGEALIKLDDAPSVDAVPVVRCKDCKHQEKTFHADKRMKNGGYYVYFCDLAEDYSHVCLDDDFCSKGERKNDG